MYKERLGNYELSSSTAEKDLGGCNRGLLPCPSERETASDRGPEERSGQPRRKSSSSTATEKLQATYL